MNFNFDKQYVLSLLEDILTVDSPSGYTHKVMNKIGRYAKELGYDFTLSQKGTGIISVNGAGEKTVGLCAHVDTLGLMVRSVKSDGTLAVTRIGGPIISTLDGEYCRIYTRDGKMYTGTILSNSTSIHVYEDADSLKRDLNNIHIRLDEVVYSAEDTAKLGVATGDFVCIDTKTVITPTGFIKSRFLDDKLSVAILFGILKWLRDENITLGLNVKILVSSYEETGHGMAFIPQGISELIAVDMGCIGADLNCNEQQVSICAKDSSGPYDYELTDLLIRLAKEQSINYAVDIYPFYSSDASAALRAGADVKAALLGAGVASSHGMERSHYDGVENTMKLIAAYLLQ